MVGLLGVHEHRGGMSPREPCEGIEHQVASEPTALPAGIDRQALQIAGVAGAPADRVRADLAPAVRPAVDADPQPGKDGP